jgi:hypothetical protein
MLLRKNMPISRHCNFRRQKCDHERRRKYLNSKDVSIGIQEMRYVKTKVMPVIIGASGIISQSCTKYLSNTARKHEIKALQKTATRGTAHILRKVLL